MLSPGTWHEQVPRDPELNLRYRRWLMAMVKSRGRQMERELWAACRDDLLFYVNTFCFLYEPRDRATLPFCTFPCQDRAFRGVLDAIDGRYDLVIEKSRDMGASWLSLTAMDWMWRFHQNCKFIMVSRSERMVDKTDEPDSLFWKIDYLQAKLPSWLQPRYTRIKLSYVNHDNGSTITGEATTKEAGVGGRGTAMFIDEFSRIEQAAELLAGTADTSPCRIFNFTPWGAGANTAYELAKRKDVKKLRLHWSDHPHKNKGLYQFDNVTGQRKLFQPDFLYPDGFAFVDDGRLRSVVYDAEEKRRTQREMAVNWDIDYHGSSYQFFDRQLIVDYQRQFCCEPFIEGDLSHDPDLGRPLDWVTVTGGPIKLWMNLDGEGRAPADKYVVACDISTGTGATNSCLTAIRILTGEKVMEWATPFMRADQFASKVVSICRWLKDQEGEGAFLAWEMQGPGRPFGDKVIELGYRHIYYRKANASPWAKTTEFPGWVPMVNTRIELFERYRSALVDRDIINRSKDALDECLSIIHHTNGDIQHSGAVENKDPTGARANHGDRVVADALCWLMVRDKQGPKTVKTEQIQPRTLAWRRQEQKREDREKVIWE